MADAYTPSVCIGCISAVVYQGNIPEGKDCGNCYIFCKENVGDFFDSGYGSSTYIGGTKSPGYPPPSLLQALSVRLAACCALLCVLYVALSCMEWMD